MNACETEEIHLQLFLTQNSVKIFFVRDVCTALKFIRRIGYTEAK